jgi:hypothetical protein
MAIQAVGAISGASSSVFALSRNVRAAGAMGAMGPGLRPVEAVGAVVRREDSSREVQADAAVTATGPGDAKALAGTEGGRSTGTPALDRRGPESILGRDGSPRPSPNDLERRLADLEAEKARGEKRRADLQGARSLETARVLSQLRSRDAHVRGHEAAHVGAGGAYVRGGASYSYQKGPDGRQYAVGGEVGIDSSPVPGKPAETAAKARIVRAAALAPSDPSAADLAIAGAASEMEAAALAELAAMRADAAAKGYGAEQAKGGGSGEASIVPRAIAAGPVMAPAAGLATDSRPEPRIDLVA